MTAREKWNNINKETQEKLLNNVWCRDCNCTKMVNYRVYSDPCGIVLHGVCNKCGKKVARVIEIDK